MNENLNRVLNAANSAMNVTAETASKLVAKGRDKVEAVALQAKVAKAQRQLGALVYVLHKTGQANDELIDQYVDEIDELKKQLAALERPQNGGVTVVECTSCGAEAREDAMFCSSCGEELSSK